MIGTSFVLLQFKCKMANTTMMKPNIFKVRRLRFYWSLNKMRTRDGKLDTEHIVASNMLSR